MKVFVPSVVLDRARLWWRPLLVTDTRYETCVAKHSTREDMTNGKTFSRLFINEFGDQLEDLVPLFVFRSKRVFE